MIFCFKHFLESSSRLLIRCLLFTFHFLEFRRWISLQSNKLSLSSCNYLTRVLIKIRLFFCIDFKHVRLSLSSRTHHHIRRRRRKGKRRRRKGKRRDRRNGRMRKESKSKIKIKRRTEIINQNKNERKCLRSEF